MDEPTYDEATTDKKRLRVVYGQEYQVRGIILYILVDANWGNGRDIPNMSEFMLSTDNHHFWSCLIS